MNGNRYSKECPDTLTTRKKQNGRTWLYFKMRKKRFPTVLMTYEAVRRGNQRKKERRDLRKAGKLPESLSSVRTAQGTVTAYVTAKGIHKATARRDLQMVQGSRDFSPVPLLEDVLLGGDGILLLIHVKKTW